MPSLMAGASIAVVPVGSEDWVDPAPMHAPLDGREGGWNPEAEVPEVGAAVRDGAVAEEVTVTGGSQVGQGSF